MARRKAIPLWQPRYAISAAAARSLMEIEAARAVVEHTPLPPAAEHELRRRARIRSAHYSTRIEGNRLTLAEAQSVIEGRGLRVEGMERDAREVRNYWAAFLKIEEWASTHLRLTEERIQRLHGIVERGPRAAPTPYRDGQNVIRDASTGRIVYLPPEAADVSNLMASLVDWHSSEDARALPAPIVAGLLHYQFVTIHPYYDGNGRTARLLATFALHTTGYGLHGFYSLEEYYARDLEGYYQALAVHPHHNYYEGRADADLTGWVEYFLRGLARVFALAQEEAERHSERPDAPQALMRLDARARRVLSLFASAEAIRTAEVARELGIPDRTARALLTEWTTQGWIEMADASRKARAYRLSAEYRQNIGKISAGLE